MNDIEKPLLICKLTQPISEEGFQRVREYLKNLSEKIGAEVVITESMDVSYTPPMGDLVNAIREQAAAIDNMAASLGELTAVLAEEIAGEEGKPESYLDGSKVSVDGEDDDDLEIPQPL